MHRNRAVPAMRRDDGNPLSTVFIKLKRTLLVTGLQAILVGKNPDLQEVHEFGLRCIVLAMADSRTRAHALHVAESDNRARPVLSLCANAPSSTYVIIFM